ncbi:MAG: YdeI/OmpD-associated family protein [Phycisphaerales bacterium]
MAIHAPEVDAYIERAQPFARPILRRLRTIVHRACPECVEVMKWSFPHFDHKGMLCSMAAFKSHCAFGFWKAALLSDAEHLLEKADRTAMGHLGRLTSLEDLPSARAIASLVKEAMRLNDNGIAAPRTKKKRPTMRTPAEFMAALRGSPKALANFNAFAPSYRRDYIEWIAEAKTDATRARRIATAVGWLAEGKRRNWKHEVASRRRA